MFPNNITQYESTYREGTVINVANGDTVSFDTAALDHRAVIIQNKDSVARNVSITFYGTTVGSVPVAANSTSLVVPANGTLISPYIIPCRLRSLTIDLLANPNNNGLGISLIN